MTDGTIEMEKESGRYFYIMHGIKIYLSDAPLTESEAKIYYYMIKNAVLCIPVVDKGAKDLGVSRAYYHRVSVSLREKGVLGRDGSRHTIQQD